MGGGRGVGHPKILYATLVSNSVGHNPKVLEVQFSRVKILLETNEIVIVCVLRDC